MITKKAEYAIIILSELASHPEGSVITSKAIAKKQSIPVNLVVQLTSILKEAGWAIGSRGPAGGITLIADPDKITLREVIETVDGKIGITRCLFNEKPCRDQKHCSLRGIWDRAQSSMLAVLDDVTIKELSQSFSNGNVKI